MIDIASLYS